MANSMAAFIDPPRAVGTAAGWARPPRGGRPGNSRPPGDQPPSQRRALHGPPPQPGGWSWCSSLEVLGQGKLDWEMDGSEKKMDGGKNGKGSNTEMQTEHTRGHRTALHPPTLIQGQRPGRLPPAADLGTAREFLKDPVVGGPPVRRGKRGWTPRGQGGGGRFLAKHWV